MTARARLPLPSPLKRFDRLIIYVATGSVLALCQLSLTAALAKGEGLDPTVASVVTSLIILPVAFWAHKRTTYADVARQPFQATRFFITAATSLVIAAGTIKAVELSGGSFWLGLFLGSALVPFGNYAVNALWVFRTKSFFSRHGGSS